MQGGSFLSSIGGTVRGGEFSAGRIAHALKLEAYAHDFYWAGWSGPDCYSWPALACDGYARQGGSGGYNGTNPLVKPGALLAVPPAAAPAVRAALRTGPGLTLLGALESYGGYIVDDTAGDSGEARRILCLCRFDTPQRSTCPVACPLAAAICMDPSAIAELQSGFNISVNITGGAFPDSTGPTGDFFNDIVTLFRALAVVSNSGPGDIGGPGPRAAPTALPIC